MWVVCVEGVYEDGYYVVVFMCLECFVYLLVYCYLILVCGFGSILGLLCIDFFGFCI